LPVQLAAAAPAKVNLTLRVLRRRDDGYHEIESLVAFADFGDRLSLSPGGELTLQVSGPSAAAAGDGADNQHRLTARNNFGRQKFIWGFVGPILLANIEPQEGPPLLRDVVPDRSGQDRVLRFDRVQDRAQRDRSGDFECHLAVHASQSS